MKIKLLLLTLLTSLFSFAQEGTNLIEFSTDTSFDYQYPNNTANIEDWNQFYNENKTTNPKPTILKDPILEEGYQNITGIVYDNENNAYFVSSIESNDGFLYSIKEYNVETNSWREIVNDTIVPDIGGPFINGIYKNSNGDYFIGVEYIHLSNNGPGYHSIFDIFTINNEKKINLIYTGSIIYPYDSFIYKNDHFYKISNGGLEYEDVDGETIEIITVYIKKSTNTTTLSIDAINITPSIHNIKFENGKFTSQEYEITNILNITGQSVPNKDLESNVIYIVVMSNSSGVKYSAKILTQ